MHHRIPKDVIERIRNRHHGYKLLLVSQFVYLLMLPLAQSFPILTSLLLVCLSLVLIGAVSRYTALKQPRRNLYVLGFLAIGMEMIWHFALMWYPGLGVALTVPHVILWVAFLLISLLRLVRSLVREPFVTVDVVLGAASGYLQIAVAGGVMLVALWVLHPASFMPSELPPAPPVGGSSGLSVAALHVAPALMASSFNLLTTVGSSVLNTKDVSAQVAITLITVSGQLYVAILIALILGRFHKRTR